MQGFFAEFILSEIQRSFAALRMTSERTQNDSAYGRITMRPYKDCYVLFATPALLLASPQHLEPALFPRHPTPET